jgi:hypothetical protein
MMIAVRRFPGGPLRQSGSMRIIVLALGFALLFTAAPEPASTPSSAAVGERSCRVPWEGRAPARAAGLLAVAVPDVADLVAYFNDQSPDSDMRADRAFYVRDNESEHAILLFVRGGCLVGAMPVTGAVIAIISRWRAWRVTVS